MVLPPSTRRCATLQNDCSYAPAASAASIHSQMDDLEQNVPLSTSSEASSSRSRNIHTVCCTNFVHQQVKGIQMHQSQ